MPPTPDLRDLYRASDPGELPKHPRYPYASVILLYLFFGGAVGGFWFFVFNALVSSNSVSWSPIILLFIMMSGALIGAIPALLCGTVLTVMRRYRGWISTAIAALSGLAATAALPILAVMRQDGGQNIWQIIGVLSLCGTLSAASLAWLVLPAKPKPADDAPSTEGY